MEEIDNPELFLCVCNSADHQFIIHYGEMEGDREAYCEINLCNYDSIWKRLWYAIKYVFGYKSRYGAFDEIIFDKRHAEKFKHLGQYLNGEDVTFKSYE